MIYTTYYAKMKNIEIDEDREAIIIQASRTRPYSFNYENLFNMSSVFGNHSGSLQNFREYLFDFLQEDKEIEKLYKINEKGNVDIFLCCYEKDYRKCHRSIIAEQLNLKFAKKYKTIIKEWGVDEDD